MIVARKMNIPMEEPAEKATTKSTEESTVNPAEIPAEENKIQVQSPQNHMPSITPMSKPSPVAPVSAPPLAEQNSPNKNNAKPYIIFALLVLLAIGKWYFQSEDKSPAPVSPTPLPNATSDTQNNKQNSNSPSHKPSLPASTPAAAPLSNMQSKLKEAEAELQQYGMKYHIDATSYGHSPDGFLAMDNTQGVLLIVDRKNHQAAEVWPKNMNLNQLRQQKNMSSPSPIIVEFKIPNAVRDSDAPYGKWVGNMHIFPIYCSYKFNSAGNIIPGMLTSGKGANPSHYQDYLQEQRSVDLANLFLTEAIPFYVDYDNRK